MSCSGEKADTGDPSLADTAQAADDTTSDVRRMRMVVGGLESGEPDSLKEIDPQTFNGWKAVVYQNVRVMCPPTHAHAGQLDQMAQAIDMAMIHDCQFLRMNMPRDTLVVMYYTGPGQGKEVTGMNHSFALNDTLHHWPPNHLGTPIMKYLIPKWQPGPPGSHFLRNGLLTLLDNSGENYHERTVNNHRRGTLEHLSELAVNPYLEFDEECRQSAMAASFVDFVVFNFGVETFKRLWDSDGDFETAVNEEFNITVDSLHTLWVTMLEEVFPEP
jgi:hypothetical protein